MGLLIVVGTQLVRLYPAASTAARASSRAMKRTPWPRLRNCCAAVSVGPRWPGLPQEATRKLWGIKHDLLDVSLATVNRGREAIVGCRDAPVLPRQLSRTFRATFGV